MSVPSGVQGGEPYILSQGNVSGGNYFGSCCGNQDVIWT